MARISRMPGVVLGRRSVCAKERLSFRDRRYSMPPAPACCKRRAVMNPTTELVWLGFAETVTLVAGGCILAASLTRGTPRFAAKPFANPRTVRLARLVYAAALPVIGLSHFVYVEATTSLVPAWLPYRTALAYGTGAAQVAAGLGLLVAVIPQAAALLEALLISSFTVLVWVPRVVANPGTRLPWTALFVSTAIAGAAWAVAESFEGAPGGPP